MPHNTFTILPIEAFFAQVPPGAHIQIYTDGACSGNPGPGGWAFLMIYDKIAAQDFGNEAATTNNRMELNAALQAVKALPTHIPATLHTDSRYVRDGMSTWIHGWQRNGWKSSTGKAIKNQDLWQDLVQSSATHKIRWEWVAGHSDHPLNDHVDSLARQAILALQIVV